MTARGGQWCCLLARLPCWKIALISASAAVCQTRAFQTGPWRDSGAVPSPGHGAAVHKSLGLGLWTQDDSRSFCSLAWYFYNVLDPAQGADFAQALERAVRVAAWKTCHGRPTCFPSFGPHL